jgi:hypothetical protein
MVERPPFPSVGRLLQGFLLGGGYLALVSATLAGTTGASYLAVLSVVFATALTLFALTLAVVLRWSLRDRPGRFQLELASLFTVMAIVAVYLAAVRWLVQNMATGQERVYPESWVAILIQTLVVSLLSIPFVLLLGDSILALAAWLVWRPWVQAVLRRWLRKP